MAYEAVNRVECHAGREGCPACGSARLESFYKATDVPVNSCILMSSREEALNYPKGEIELCCCQDCGFVFNSRFDPTLTQYSDRYEETQGYSDTFNAFHKRLAQELVTRHDLYNREILEIGCGKGEFLTLICELGDNWGTGFDPAYVAERSRAPRSDRTTFVTDFYSEKYSGHDADFLCCKMTLEHIPEVREFIGMVREAIGDRESTIVFFQVPEAGIIFNDCRFWDIYYEHCSYFHRGSLVQLFRNSGFRVTKTWVDYEDQYLMIEALPVRPTDVVWVEDDAATLQEILDATRKFTRTFQATVAHWSKIIQDRRSAGGRIVLWGSGSKAVSFLSTLGLAEEITHVVDINPYRRGMFMPGSGHRIVGPEDLPAIGPDTVIILNPIYLAEISETLAREGLQPELLSL